MIEQLLDQAVEAVTGPLEHVTIPTWLSPATLSAVAVILAAIVVAVRTWRTGAARRQRIRLAVVPATGADPTPEEVWRYVSRLASATQSPRWAAPSARCVRVSWRTSGDSSVVQLLEGPRAAAQLLRSRALADVEYVDPTTVMAPPTDDEQAEQQKQDRAAKPHRKAVAVLRRLARRKPVAGLDLATAGSVARARIELADDPARPLRDPGLRPDPIELLANAMGEARDDLGDAIALHLDLIAEPTSRVHRRHRRALANKQPTGTAATTGWIDQLADGMGVRSSSHAGRPRARSGRRGPLELEDAAHDRALATSLADTGPYFRFQLLIVARSDLKGRAHSLLASVLASLSPWTSMDNRLRAAGMHLGARHLGANLPWRRAGFDRCVEGRRFQSSTRQVVSASTIGGLVKPATKHCRAGNVIRTSGLVPPPPRSLPTFDPSAADQMPWGVVNDHNDTRTVAVDLAETFFTWTGGRARFGKTETSLSRVVHLARHGHGVLFLDPHADALERLKPFIADQSDRIVELSIAREARDRQVGWNPFSTAGLAPTDLEARGAAIVNSFASAMNWGSTSAPRALTLMQASTSSLLELSLKLPDDIAPTVFQMITLLSDESWRADVVKHLSPPLQSFWRTRFPVLSPEAITPVTNVLDRLRQSASVAALLGSSRSTYDLRNAMDNGSIVLVRLSGTGQIDQLIASFVVYDLLRCVLGRTDIHASQRRPFHAFLDEVQSYDSSVRGLLASALEEGGKFGLRLHLANQQPTRLAKETLEALLVNRSHLMTTALGRESARLIAGEIGGRDLAPETIQALDRYHFLTSVTHRGHPTTPFRAGGLSLDAMYEPCPDEHLPELQSVIERNSGAKPIDETIAALDQLDAAIADWLDESSKVVTLHPRDDQPPLDRPDPSGTAPRVRRITLPKVPT